MKIKDSTSAPGADEEMIFKSSSDINRICVAQADDED
jgi:hypothetical protein